MFLVYFFYSSLGISFSYQSDAVFIENVDTLHFAFPGAPAAVFSDGL